MIMVELAVTSALRIRLTFSPDTHRVQSSQPVVSSRTHLGTLKGLKPPVSLLSLRL